MPERINPKLLSWLPPEQLDPQTVDQAYRTSNLPFIAGHVALMPDAHFGRGATVGSVIPTDGAIVPAAVGVDIGCGMIAARLDLRANDLPDDLAPLHSAIASAVPAGVGQGHADPTPPKGIFPFPQTGAWNDRLVEKAVTQYGSLGSGNHFIEVCLDEFDDVWVVLHSGSRGVGNELAKHHIDGAKQLMKRYFIELDDPDLAYLAEDTAEFDAYIADMTWAQDYAMGNRQQMLVLVLNEVMRFLDRPVVPQDVIDCHHNYTAREHHRGRNMWVTRKGAIRARTGDRGVIPGSMGAASFIVKGLGNVASYHSCAHGAGRRLSRKAARRALSTETLEAMMAGKAWNHDADGLLDEHPGAYKDVDDVMAAQADLVAIEHRLHQILNYKGC